MFFVCRAVNGKNVVFVGLFIDFDFSHFFVLSDVREDCRFAHIEYNLETPFLNLEKRKGVPLLCVEK